MTEILGGIAVLAFIVLLAGTSALFDIRRMGKERRARELTLLEEQERERLIQKTVKLAEITFIKRAKGSLSRGVCKELAEL